MSESPDDIYADFAERYDRFSGPIGEPAPVRLAFFRRLFAQHQVQLVLDCACGTGRDLILFRALGCQVGERTCLHRCRHKRERTWLGWD